jgi:hypothetical protein
LLPILGVKSSFMFIEFAIASPSFPLPWEKEAGLLFFIYL